MVLIHGGNSACRSLDKRQFDRALLLCNLDPPLDIANGLKVLGQLCAIARPDFVLEPRYLAMLDDCLKLDHRLIGMIQPFEAPESGPPKLHQIGCAGRIIAFSETEDGRYLVTLSGLSRFRITSEIEGFTPYRRVNVSWTDFARDLGIKGIRVDTVQPPTILDQMDERTAFDRVTGAWKTAAKIAMKTVKNEPSSAMPAPGPT